MSYKTPDKLVPEYNERINRRRVYLSRKIINQEANGIVPHFDIAEYNALDFAYQLIRSNPEFARDFMERYLSSKGDIRHDYI